MIPVKFHINQVIWKLTIVIATYGLPLFLLWSIKENSKVYNSSIYFFCEGVIRIRQGSISHHKTWTDFDTLKSSLFVSLDVFSLE